MNVPQGKFPEESPDPGRWLDDHGDYLFKYAVFRLRDNTAAEDAVQETFLAALKAYKEFQGRASERTWLVGILKHKIINLRHGMSEYYVDDAEFIVKIPRGLKEVGVLLEPTTVVEKGIAQAYEIQRRLKVWKPKRAAVMGAGTIGLLATLVLRLKGLQVTTFGKTPKPYLNSDLIEAIGATYQSTDELSILAGAKEYGPFDIIFEATGFSPVVFDSMQALGKNGVLVLSSVTGGDRKVEVPADKINLEFVLGNKVMVGTVNANREYFEMGVKDLAQAEAEYPGWLSRLLTHPVRGLQNYQELFAKLTNPNGAIKVFCEVAEL